MPYSSLLAGFKMTEASEKADSGVENPSLSMSVASSPAHQQIFSDDYVELEEPDSAILHDDLDNNADYADAQENDSKSDSQNDESKKRRPKILPPENDDNNAKTSEDAERTENNIRNIRLSTLRKRKNFRPNSCGVGPQRKVARSRYLVQVNRPGDENPPRKVFVERRTPASSICRDYAELGYCLRGNNCPFPHGANTIVVNGPPAVYQSQVPSVGYPQQPYQSFPKRQKTNSFLVRKIPREYNNIFKINEYFSEFGEIKHIQVAFDEPDTALVTYESVDSATKAFMSKKAIFDNRFVSLKWYMPPNEGSVGGVQSGGFMQPIAVSTAAAPPSMISGQPQQQPSPVVGANALPQKRRSEFTKNFGGASTATSANAPSSDVLAEVGPRTTVRNGKAIAEQKDEKILSLKTDLYLKLSEQIRLMLLKAQSAQSRRVKREVLDKVTELQKTLEETRDSLVELYSRVHPGKKPPFIDA